MHKKTLEAICEVFDAYVMWDDSTDKDGFPVEHNCSLGNSGDMSVGIAPFWLTPFFDTEDALRQFVESEEGWAHINANAKEIFPGDWDPKMQGWTDEGCNAFSGRLWHSD